jgi:AcrR family transcriptional regulator
MQEQDSNLRRSPKQDRSRERVEEILGAAKQLIGEKGIDAVKMREIAALAGGPISSLYQYFPNKSSIVSMLHNQWISELDSVLETGLEKARDLEELCNAAVSMLEYYYQRIVEDPAILDMINAVQADKSSKGADIAATRRHADQFCESARSFIPAQRFEAFQRVTFLMFQLASGAVRLALALGPDESDAVIGDYKIMIRTQLTAFACAKSASIP